MRPEPDITRVVRSWLVEGTDRLPDRVLDTVLDLVPSTQQRRSVRSAWRLPAMLTPARAAIVAAAIIVASAATFALLPRGTGVGFASPSIAPSPTASPVASSAARASAAATPVLLDFLERRLDPGDYSIDQAFAVPFRISFPTSWTMRGLSAGDANFVRATPAEAAPWVSIDVIDNVAVDPCHPEGSGGLRSPAPSTVAEVVTALTHMNGFPASRVTDVMVGGLPGKSFQITNTVDTSTAGCSGGPMLPMFTFRGGPALGGGTNGGATERIWVVDVHDTIIVIDGEFFPSTPDAATQEMDAVVQSIVFE